MDLFFSFTMMGFGEFISLVFQSLYVYDYLEDRGLMSWSLIVVTALVSALLLVGLIYLIIKTVRMRRNITAMGTVLGEEGEVTELLDDLGKKGWISIYGENWKFRSEKPLKQGDLVKVTRHKKMDLIVEKITEDL